MFCWASCHNTILIPGDNLIVVASNFYTDDYTVPEATIVLFSLLPVVTWHYHNIPIPVNVFEYTFIPFQ